ncbi:MAG: glycosyltransferase family 39 protein, partial [bacterium]
MERKLLYMVAGAALIALGILLPQAWYDALPTLPDAPLPPIKGVHLLQASLIFEGLVVLWLASRRWSFVRMEANYLLRPLADASSAPERSQVSFWVVAGITALALALRLFRVNSDLWFDEIATVLDYRQVPLLQVVASYVSANNHLLNTLLVKLSIGLFGEEEWAIRLSAVLFGTATIPIMYWLARLVFPVWASASAALLLAVSYHHIFYSQNARGYAAYLFFSLLATRLLIDAVQHDRLRTWGVYIACMFLNFAALLNSVFVFVAHVLVGGGAVWAVWRRGASPVPLVRRLVAVFAIAAFLVFQLYATALPQAYVTLRMTYVQQTSGYTMSRDLLDELIRGLSAGLGVGLFLLAVPFLAVAGAGFVLLYRRQWPVALSLSAPLFLNAAVLVARKLTISPRFFLLALPLAILAVVQSLVSLAEWAGRSAHGPRRSRAMAVSLVVVAASISLLS